MEMGSPKLSLLFFIKECGDSGLAQLFVHFSNVRSVLVGKGKANVVFEGFSGSFERLANSWKYEDHIRTV
jgi:hypothetical protein